MKSYWCENNNSIVKGIYLSQILILNYTPAMNLNVIGGWRGNTFIPVKWKTTYVCVVGRSRWWWMFFWCMKRNWTKVCCWVSTSAAIYRERSFCTGEWITRICSWIASACMV